MELAQLQLVKQILETGSLSKTAIRLNRAQSVVSRQLAALERDCGGRIFYRNGRGVLLTELGERLLPQIELILAAADDMTGSGAQLKNDFSGTVKITVTPYVASNLVGPLFTKVKESYPNIRLSIWESYSCSIESELQQGHTDIAVFMRSGTTVGRDDRVIGDIDTHLIGLPNAPATRGKTIAFSELVGLPLIMPSMPSALRRSVEEIAASKGLSLTIFADVNAPYSTRALLHEGAGYLVTPLGPGAAMTGEVEAGELSAIRIVEPVITRKMVLATSVNPRRRVDAVARIVETMLRDIVNPQSSSATPAVARILAQKRDRRVLVG